ncbi:SRPBCC family protein, partial [uncultured Prevotella sp.]|uniref:SRPBCC family protein n=1 Tax=uncultured Prevotella sp. TaxID=159272 RepID=UPI0027E2AD38
MSTFESSIRQIPYPQQNVYDKLSDLSNLKTLKERYELMKDNMPEEARKQAEAIKDLQFDQDSLTVNVPPVGTIRLKVVDREEPKCIKFETEQSPVPFNFWIQLLPVTTTSCKMKLTIKADLNPFIKQMVKKPLSEGIEKIADVLQMIQYN